MLKEIKIDWRKYDIEICGTTHTRGGDPHKE